jgi:putative membrane protein
LRPAGCGLTIERVTSVKRWLPLLLLAWYLALSAVLAIAPADRQNWVLANVLPAAFVAVLVAGNRLLPLSNGAYGLVAAFMSLHTVGVHYTYAKVPLGAWIAEALGSGRNDYDRIVHFAFGLLLTLPLQEAFAHVTRARAALLRYLAVTTVLALSALWEIIEALVAQAVSPELGLAYLGAQGDPWDAQRDMAAALLGSLLAVAVAVALVRRGRQGEVAIGPEAHSTIGGRPK